MKKIKYIIMVLLMICTINLAQDKSTSEENLLTEAEETLTVNKIEQGLAAIEKGIEKIKQLREENLVLIIEAEKKAEEVKNLLSQGKKEEAFKLAIEIKQMYEKGKNNYWQGRAIYEHLNKVYLKLTILVKKIVNKFPNLGEKYIPALKDIHTRCETLKKEAKETHKKMVQVNKKIKDIVQNIKIETKERLIVKLESLKQSLIEVTTKIQTLHHENKTILDEAKQILQERRTALKNGDRKKVLELTLKLRKLGYEMRQNYWQAKTLYKRAVKIYHRSLVICRQFDKKFPEIAQKYHNEFKDARTKIEALRVEAKQANRFWKKVNREAKIIKRHLRQIRKEDFLNIINKYDIIEANIAKVKKDIADLKNLVKNKKLQEAKILKSQIKIEIAKIQIYVRRANIIIRKAEKNFKELYIQHKAKIEKILAIQKAVQDLENDLPKTK